MLKFEALYIGVVQYGPNKGRLIGHINFRDEQGALQCTELPPQMTENLLSKAGDILALNSSHQLSALLKAVEPPSLSE